MENTSFQLSNSSTAHHFPTFSWKVKSESEVAQSCPTLCDPMSMGFSRQEYWSGLPCPSPEDLPNTGIEPRSPALQADSFCRLFLLSEPPGARCGYTHIQSVRNPLWFHRNPATSHHTPLHYHGAGCHLPFPALLQWSPFCQTPMVNSTESWTGCF